MKCDDAIILVGVPTYDLGILVLARRDDEM